MKKEKIIAYHHITAFGGIAILDMQHGLDDKVETAFYQDGKCFENKAWNKVYYARSGEPYFKKGGVRYYLQDFMTTDY